MEVVQEDPKFVQERIDHVLKVSNKVGLNRNQTR